MKYKKCSKCKKNSDINNFHRMKRNKDGLYSSCKDCVRFRMGNKKRVPREIKVKGVWKRSCITCKKFMNKTFFYTSKCYRKGISESCKDCSRKLANTELQKTRMRGKRQLVRMEVLIHYGGNPPKCKCCGESTVEFLCIDHINGGGSKKRKALGNGHMYTWIRNNYPEDLQVLCHNCNMAKGFYGTCPHKLEKVD